MSVVAPSEDLAMVPLGKDSSPAAQLAQPHTQEPSSDDAKATLPWDRAQHDAAGEMPEVLEMDARPSPEGSMKAAALGSAMDHQAFLKPLEDDGCSGMPAMATHAFIPIDPLCIERRPRSHKKQPWQLGMPPQDRALCQEEKCDLEQQTFLGRGCSDSLHDLPDPAVEPSQTHCCQTKGCCNSANLKAVASMTTALIIFPVLIYSAYVFLPFDVPVMESMSARLVYTLRCGAFATFPIILGMMVYGVSRLCASSLQPFEELTREVEIHRHFVSQSVDLFILYFFNIAVLSTYLPQEGLKVIPLLTALFAISRLLYWLAYAMGRSFRGFGFGLTFLPLVAMLVFNLYSMFLLDTENMFAVRSAKSPLQKEELDVSRSWYWG
ncbi:transmembrane protein 79 [Notechis scutatus]|uniref:Transmembrane protein 79 n=1 Tax=Notechis scutatus TaxID=8663 RepID=A0A6J1VSR7_9SAUR|nr:transmembrane protein 79 [Notechis scutatus]XP_026546162.1 transmembrane protein 79 [Notechis scutatus]